MVIINKTDIAKPDQLTALKEQVEPLSKLRSTNIKGIFEICADPKEKFRAPAKCPVCSQDNIFSNSGKGTWICANENCNRKGPMISNLRLGMEELRSAVHESLPDMVRDY